MALHPDFMNQAHLRDRLYQHFKQQLARIPRAESCSIAENELRQFCERKPQLNRADMEMLWELWTEMAYLGGEPLAPMIQVYRSILNHYHISQHLWADRHDEWIQQALDRAVAQLSSMRVELREPAGHHDDSLSPPSLCAVSQDSMASWSDDSISSSLSSWGSYSPGNTPPSQSQPIGQLSLSPILLPDAAHRWLPPLLPVPEHD